MHINANIRVLRRKHKMTQRDLAEKLDKAYITIGDYERGKAIPPLVTILRMCEIFDVNLETIVFHDMESKGSDPTRPSSASAEVERLHTQLDAQKQHIQLLTEHLNILKQAIKEHAPELAARLGL